MPGDLLIILRWWVTILIIGLVAYPLTQKIFTEWFDQGYLFAKSLGLALVTYGVFFLGVWHIVPFTSLTIILVMGLLFLVGLYLKPEKPNWKVIFIEEVCFLTALVFWSFVKGHEASIHGLEKFMDYGFMKSILNSSYFPSPDMWLAGQNNYINYYYFGHTVVALLTKLSGLDLAFTFNLTLSTIFAFTLTLTLTLTYQLTKNIWVSLLTAYIVTLGGNLQTIYAWTKGYTGDTPPPFWTIWTGKLDPGYWYANATRFIPWTIHEFPSYSFVVSDVHGHVLSIPFVLLTLGLVITIFGLEKRNIWLYVLYGFMAGILLMTNALDGPIYAGLFVLLVLLDQLVLSEKLKAIGLMALSAGLTALPFLIHFKSFVTGLALNCPPVFLANSRIGPLLFEGIEKCQHSPLWMWLILWGLFLYCGAWFVLKLKPKQNLLITILFFVSLGLIIFPEFLYFKDIYPLHFRSNTMFKLGYQAFIMFGLVCGFTIHKLRNKWFYLGLVPLLFLVCSFPYFSIRSYFGNLETYHGLDGLAWFKQQYPEDMQAINWLNTHSYEGDVLVEADGDSYTDYARFSAFTGRPTIIGWAVHEWLWRGSYDPVALRREDVRQIYESPDLEITRGILNKYRVSFVVIGALERQKFTKLQEQKLLSLASPVFTSGSTTLLHIQR